MKITITHYKNKVKNILKNIISCKEKNKDELDLNISNAVNSISHFPDVSNLDHYHDWLSD